MAAEPKEGSLVEERLECVSKLLFDSFSDGSLCRKYLVAEVALDASVEVYFNKIRIPKPFISCPP